MNHLNMKKASLVFVLKMQNIFFLGTFNEC